MAGENLLKSCLHCTDSYNEISRMELPSMSNTANIAMTALQSVAKKLDVTADNIANVNSENFIKSRSILEEVYPTGVKVSISRIDTSGMPLPADASNPDIKETSNVSVEDEFADLIVTHHMYTADLTIIRTEEEMQGTLLNVIT